MEQDKTQFLICPVCGGWGFKDKRRCPECFGVGLGKMIGNDFVYWKKKINRVEITVDKASGAVKKVREIFLVLLGVGGLAGLAYHLRLADWPDIFTASFWRENNPYVLLFWVSLLGDMYFFYLINRKAEKDQQIKKKKYDLVQAARIIEPKTIKEVPKEQNLNVYEVLDAAAKQILAKAWFLADKLNHSHVAASHLLATMLDEKRIKVIFGRLGVDGKALNEKIKSAIQREKNTPLPSAVLSLEARKILIQAYAQSFLHHKKKIGAEELLIALGQEESLAKEALLDLEITEDKLRNVAAWLKAHDQLRQNYLRFKKKAKLRPKGQTNKAMTALATPFLEQFSHDLTALAAQGYLAPCVDREKEFESIFRVIESGHNSVILVGNPGVGKNTIAEGIAQRMVEGGAPAYLQDKRFVSLSLAKLIGGAAPAEAEERLLRIIQEAVRSGNVILYISGIQNMIGITSGRKESLDLAGVLSDIINKKMLLVIATATPVDYARYIENSSLGEAFRKVNIEEPDLNGSIQILEAKSAVLESRNQIFFSYSAIETAVKFAARYIHERYMPEKALRILEEVAVFTRKRKGANGLVGREDVAQIFAEKTNIPLTKLGEEETQKLLHLEEQIHRRMIDQEEAVNMVAASLRRARTELRDAKRPIVNLLFLGPTGVGKTELAKSVAEVYFGDEENMVRLDMSEYQEPASINRLIGGIDEGSRGQLTEAIRQNPFSLLLLDELEKAHPDVLNIFLQVMDDGRLTDGMGRTIDFTNVIIIATSNAGTASIQEGIKQGKDISVIKNELLENELKKYYRPEFINRFDGVVVFKPLSLKNVEAIAELMFHKVSQRLEEQGMTFQYTKKAIQEIAKAGFDPTFGARPLRRVIQEHIDDQLAKLLLEGKLKRRDKIVVEGMDDIKIIKAEPL